MSTGLHARQATGLTVAEREDSFTRIESVARPSREGRAAYETERSSVVLFLFFSSFLFDWFLVFQSGMTLLHERGRGFFSYRKVSVSFSLLLLCCCAAVLCFPFRTYEYRHTAYQFFK